MIVDHGFEPEEEKSVARILELCACHSEGIKILEWHLTKVVNIVDYFLKRSNSDFISIKYPAATVLLDLTASESCIEQVAKLIHQKDLF